MGAQGLGSLRRTLTKVGAQPERLWLLSIALHRSGRWRLAFAVKQLNTILYHNSLAPAATSVPISRSITTATGSSRPATSRSAGARKSGTT